MGLLKESFVLPNMLTAPDWHSYYLGEDVPSYFNALHKNGSVFSTASDRKAQRKMLAQQQKGLSQKKQHDETKQQDSRKLGEEVNVEPIPNVQGIGDGSGSSVGSSVSVSSI